MNFIADNFRAKICSSPLEHIFSALSEDSYNEKCKKCNKTRSKINKELMANGVPAQTYILRRLGDEFVVTSNTNKD
jgi:hypothetical protein